MNDCDVAIVGAGPYGLSIAAHLRAAGVNFRIFGDAMEFWLKHMPEGMHLKSEGFASSLYDPEGKFTLKNYCNERGLRYADIGDPVPLEVFAAYGQEFQKRYAPQLESKKVTSVERAPAGFRVTLEDGHTFAARRVVIAVGLTYFSYLPEGLASLPQSHVTHSSQHSRLDGWNGRRVAIVGAGASALDLAALLHQAGAVVDVVARVPRIRFQDPPDSVGPSWVDRLRTPVTGIGVGWKLYACANMPLVFRRMPKQFRIDKVSRILGPAPCWFTRGQVEGKIGFKLGVSIESASVQSGAVHLQLTDAGGANSELVTDHVIAATGYKPDVRHLPFLAPDILTAIKCVSTTPSLSANFESTVPDLYFVGVTAANTFGPLLRFAFGARFAAPRISRHLKRTASSTHFVGERMRSSNEGADRKAAQHVAR